MMRILATKVFDCLSGNSGLTEEFIYSKVAQNEPLYQVLSSSTLGTTKLGFIPQCVINEKTLKVFEDKQAILVARNGKAGQMTYLKRGKYTINDHAYILSLKEDFKDVLDISTDEQERDFLLWFIHTYQSKFYEYSSTSDNATWNKSDFLKMEIDIPSPQYVSKMAKLYERCLYLLSHIQEAIQKLNDLQSKNIDTMNTENKGDIPIKDLLGYVSRNDALSEEGIYHRLPDKNDREPIRVLSGSSESIYYGMVGSKTSRIHFIDNKQCLHVISRGQAGRITYLKKGKYATNTNAFLFYLLPSIKNKLGISNDEEEMTYLKFLRIYLEPIFCHASSESDLSVFPLTELMENMVMPLFLYGTHMKCVVQKYNILGSYSSALKSLQTRLDSLLLKQIVSAT